jgi:hypothetical protein
MPSRELPPRPNLDHLKKQAKALLDAAKQRDQDALRRFTLLPSLADKAADAVAAGDLALHGYDELFDALEAGGSLTLTVVRGTEEREVTAHFS